MNYIKLALGKIDLTTTLFSLLIAALFVTGIVLSNNGSIDVIPLGKALKIAYLGVFILVFFITFLTLKFIYSLNRTPAQKRLLFLPDLNSKKLWLVTFTSFLVCYLPVLVLSHSITTFDSWSSINQITGHSSLNNANPLIFTLFVGIFIKIGLFFNSIQVGLILFSVVQTLILSAIFAYALVLMRDIQTPKPLLVVSFIFYALLPLNSFMGMVMWKDVLFAGFGLVLITLIIKLHSKGLNINKRFLIVFILLAFLFCSWRLNGIYAYIAFVAVYSIVNYRALFISIKIPVLLFTPILLYAIYTICVNVTVKPSESPALYTVPLQQIARTVKYHGSSLTPAEKDTINEFLNYDEIKDTYSPTLADPAFDALNIDNFTKGKTKYMQLWYELGLKYKKTYLASFLYNTYGYSYPYYLAPSTVNLVGDNALPKNSNKAYTDSAYDSGLKYAAAIYHDTTVNLTPNLYGVGTYTLLLLASAYVAVRRRLYPTLGAFVLLATVLLTCLLGPVNGELRYFYLGVLAAPLMFSYVLYSPSVRK